MILKIYTFWTGNNPVPIKREISIKDIQKNSGVEVCLFSDSDVIKIFSDMSFKVHPAYYHLNYAHRADYLRAFFMHNIGGGYCDIKSVNNSWVPFFEQLMNNPRLFGIGVKEVSRHGVGNLYQSSKYLTDQNFKNFNAYIKWRCLQSFYKLAIGNCAFIFKPNTPITTAWWAELNNRLDQLSPMLKANPAKYPKERGGHVYDGVVSNYPVPWSYLLGDILGPLSVRFSMNMSRALPSPDFSNYQ